MMQADNVIICQDITEFGDGIAWMGVSEGIWAGVLEGSGVRLTVGDGVEHTAPVVAKQAMAVPFWLAHNVRVAYSWVAIAVSVVLNIAWVAASIVAVASL